MGFQVTTVVPLVDYLLVCRELEKQQQRVTMVSLPLTGCPCVALAGSGQEGAPALPLRQRHRRAREEDQGGFV